MKESGSSKEIALLKAQAVIRHLRDREAWLLSRMAPEEYLPFAAGLLRKVLSVAVDHPLARAHPSFFLLRSMEACCGYSHRLRGGPVQTSRIYQLFQLYRQHIDPYQLYLLECSPEPAVDLFFIAMERQQLVVQRVPGRQDYARAFYLLVEHEMPALDAACVARMGVGLFAWIACVAFVCSIGNATDSSVLNLSPYLGSFPRAAELAAVLEVVSRSPDQVKDVFRTERIETPAHLDSIIPSQFVGSPLVRLGSGKYVLTSLPLLEGCLLNGVLSLLPEDLGRESGELGDSLEAYVGRVLRELAGVETVLGGKELRALVDGKSCDYLIAAEGYVVLVESKLALLRAKLVTHGAISGSGVVRKIADAMEQLASVGAAVREDPERFGLASAEAQQVIGLVVTGSDLVLPNGGYWRSVVERKLGRGLDEIEADGGLQGHPQILPISEFEQLVSAGGSVSGVCRLVAEKLKAPYGQVGDWFSYLLNRREELQVEALGFAEVGFERLFEKATSWLTGGQAES